MSFSNLSPAETILIDLVHDLRQHLGTIETNAYCLGLLRDSTETRFHGCLRAIEQQVEYAGSRLSEASAELTRLRAQRGEAAASFPLTKSATSAVT